jgi:hypothetical protein
MSKLLALLRALLGLAPVHRNHPFAEQADTPFGAFDDSPELDRYA